MRISVQLKYRNLRLRAFDKGLKWCKGQRAKGVGVGRGKGGRWGFGIRCSKNKNALQREVGSNSIKVNPKRLILVLHTNGALL